VNGIPRPGPLLWTLAVLTTALGAAAQTADDGYDEADLIRLDVRAVWQDPETGDYLLVFTERDGDRHLAMGIGQAEAVSIAIALDDYDFGRPLTHDLLVRIILTLNAELERVIIDDVHEEAFYARLELLADDEARAIDCRPSDATALALRMEAPIYTTDELLERAREEQPAGSGADEI
jgi:hypothetical protein